MSLDTTNFNTFIEEHPDLLIKTIYEKLIRKHFYINNCSCKYNQKTNFKPFLLLGRFHNDNDKEYVMEVTLIEETYNLIEGNLKQLIDDKILSSRLDKSDSPIIPEQCIIEEYIIWFTQNLSELIFQGDKKSNDENLKKIDGFIKGLTNAPDSIKLSITDNSIEELITDNVIINVIYTIAINVPIKCYDMDEIGIFVGEEYYDNYQFALNNKYKCEFNQQNSEMKVLGFNDFKLIKAYGLNGTNKIIATPFKNIVWTLNIENEINTIEFDKIKHSDEYYFRFKTLLGVDIIKKDFAVLVDVDPLILKNSIQN